MRNYPATPDGRYFVVKGVLWRCSNPALDGRERQQWVDGAPDLNRHQVTSTPYAGGPRRSVKRASFRPTTSNSACGVM
ncbi:hypothetical protein [Pseudomonas fragi]|uniref:hypothetical protein n=1 Tax=Pseudomonas fragi TaxID=296 RepID=UPI001055ECFB|nr:hypothetical protein [Pseudomonas fragi]